MESIAMNQPTQLKRTLTFPQLLFYGLGTMVGGGFYALIGKVAGEAGMATPIAFLMSGLLALLNAFTFAELSARLPFSAGEAHYVDQAFRRQWLTRVVGFLVIITGVVSAATLSVATIGFLQDIIQIPEVIGIILLVIAMGIIAAWGVGESVLLVVIITFIEIGALIVVAIMAGSEIESVPQQLPHIWQDLSGAALIGIMAGAFLSFYAFLGFEDMVNMAEEVKDAPRTLPKAILLSVLLATTLYVIVSSIAVMVIQPNELAQANTPFAAIIGNTGMMAVVMVFVSLLTGINGALVQIIMGARVAYGMAKRGQAPALLAKVHPKSQTPLHATLLVSAIVLMLALFFPLVTLAKATSTIILMIFFLLNLALLRIKFRGDAAPEYVPKYPIILPILAGSGCLSVLLFNAWQVI
jgi:amino acid transporter